MANQNLACFVHYLKIINTLRKQKTKTKTKLKLKQKQKQKQNKQTNKHLQGLNKSSYHKNKTRVLLIEPSKDA